MGDRAIGSKMAVAVVATCIALAYALPVLTSSNYVIGIGISAAVFLLPIAGLNLVYGYAGLLSFAQLGFWGIGGYAAAIGVMDLGLDFAGCVVFAALLSGLVGLLIGWPLLRARRHAFVVATLSFALLCALVARDWVDVTRGPLGIPGLPAPTLFGHAIATPVRFYYLALGLTTILLAGLYVFATSRLGLTLRAIRDNETLVMAQGARPLPHKLAAFTITAALTGVAGAVYAFRLTIVDPLFLDFYYFQTFLISVIVGGAGSFFGPLAAGVAMVVLPELLRFSNDLRLVLYGLILVGVMLAMPRGVAGVLADRRLRAIRTRGA